MVSKSSSGIAYCRFEFFGRIMTFSYAYNWPHILKGVRHFRVRAAQTTSGNGKL